MSANLQAVPATTAQEQTQPAAIRSIKNIIADLSKPIAERHLQTKRMGGTEITFIPWHKAVKYLDLYAPAWTYEVRQMVQLGNVVSITVRITIPCLEGLVFREATGQEDVAVKGYGDSTSNAESMALRRAAAKFGLALYLYDAKK